MLQLTCSPISVELQSETCAARIQAFRRTTSPSPIFLPFTSLKLCSGLRLSRSVVSHPLLLAVAPMACSVAKSTVVTCEVSAHRLFFASLCSALGFGSGTFPLLGLSTTPQFPHLTNGSGFVAMLSKGSLQPDGNWNESDCASAA